MDKIVYLFMDLKGQPLYVGCGTPSRPQVWFQPSCVQNNLGRFARWMVENDFAAQWVIIERDLSYQQGREIESAIIRALGTIDAGGPLLNTYTGEMGTENRRKARLNFTQHQLASIPKQYR